ncbi:MAG: hypothetical protein ACKO6F_04250, partial [Cyanobium sp.]
MDPNQPPLVFGGLGPAIPSATPYGLEDYLASGVGLLPGLEATALGGALPMGVISEQQLEAWSTASGSQAVSITGLPWDSALAGLSGACSPTGPYCCPCPPPPAPVPCDPVEKSSPPCPCSTGVCEVCKCTGLLVKSTSLGDGDVRSSSGISNLLQWSNNAGLAGQAIAGSGWRMGGTPRLLLRQSDYLGARSIALPFGGTDIRTFERSCNDPNLYVRAVAAGPTDVIRRVGQELRYLGADGSTIRFADFSTAVAGLQRGQYLGQGDAAGNRVEATLNANGSIAQLRSFRVDGASADEVQSFSYSGASTTTPGRLSEVRTSRGDGTLLRRAELSYFTGTTSAGGVVIGRAGDLREVVVRDGAGGVLERSAFRYSTDSRGRSLLAYVLDDDSQRRLAAAGLDRNTVSNSQLAPYAMDFFAYDSQNRVNRHDQQGTGCTTCTGGIGTTTTSYFMRSGGGSGFNSWRFRTTETGPDGNQTITYSNGSGQTMLEVRKVLVDPANPALVGKQWGTFTAYDPSTGLTALQATPESVL